MSRILHLAIASTTSKPGEVGANLAQICDFARRAGGDGAHFLLTPEMSASGYGNYPEVLATAETAGEGPIYDRLAGAAQSSGVVISAGFVEQSEGRRFLAHYVVFPDGQYRVQRKHRVTFAEQPLEPAWPQLPPFHEDGTGTPSKIEFEVFEIAGVRSAIVICADGGMTNLQSVLDELDVRLLFLPTGAGGSREDRVTNSALKTAAGRENYSRVMQKVFYPGPWVLECLQHRRVLAAVNLCGHDGKNHYHVGHGFIINAMGEVPALIHGLPNMDRQRPLYTHAEVDLDEHL